MNYRLGEILCEVRPDISRAYDILFNAGMNPDKAAKLVISAARLGKDPEEFARKFLQLRRALAPRPEQEAGDA